MKVRPIVVTTYADKASHGLTTNELDRLAQFNAEVARGLVHTEAYATKMSKLQARFDTAIKPGVVSEPRRRRWPW